MAHVDAMLADDAMVAAVHQALVQRHPQSRRRGRPGLIAMPDDHTVRCGKIWTAAGVSAGLDLALALFAEIAGREGAEVAQLMIECDPQPPFNSGHPGKASETVREMAAAELARLARNPQDLISIPKILCSRVRGLLGIWVSGGEAEGLHFVGVLSFGDEFREDGALGYIQEKFGEALA